MMPMLSPSENPWLRLYGPIALHQPASGAKESLFKAILSASAFQKAQGSRSDRASFLQRASDYKKAAEDALSLQVDRLNHSEFNTVDAVNRKALTT
jgi:hypothetical protein